MTLPQGLGQFRSHLLMTSLLQLRMCLAEGPLAGPAVHMPCMGKSLFIGVGCSASCTCYFALDDCITQGPWSRRPLAQLAHGFQGMVFWGAHGLSQA